MIIIFIILNQDDIKLESCFSPRVFVNNIFEIQANHSLPDTKAELKRWGLKSNKSEFQKQLHT